MPSDLPQVFSPSEWRRRDLVPWNVAKQSKTNDDEPDTSSTSERPPPARWAYTVTASSTERGNYGSFVSKEDTTIHAVFESLLDANAYAIDELEKQYSAGLVEAWLNTGKYVFCNRDGCLTMDDYPENRVIGSPGCYKVSVMKFFFHPASKAQIPHGDTVFGEAAQVATFEASKKRPIGGISSDFDVSSPKKRRMPNTLSPSVLEPETVMAEVTLYRVVKFDYIPNGHRKDVDIWEHDRVEIDCGIFQKKTAAVMVFLHLALDIKLPSEDDGSMYQEVDYGNVDYLRKLSPLITFDVEGLPAYYGTPEENECLSKEDGQEPNGYIVRKEVFEVLRATGDGAGEAKLVSKSGEEFPVWW
ncbi:hypothetical protein BJ508DRAFT_320649 [Ascobolus immersus RN42]|uniref:Uncharacterized protein n=1 Tax=Ascobolus immersus RN42 TaxID=1160509 RepID=A0A3N4IQE1_ASCIM|nr:hypothetical protein BJ508DRAFT_320649 [Ascobolus immersus RN42]